jgi:hypothetical protein
MGHCAPAVMRTLLEASGAENDWPIRLVAGLPGGIGNTGGECGGVTAPLALLGLRRGLGPMHDGLPLLFHEGHALCERFERCHGTLLCSELRGDRRLPLPCVGVVRRAPELYAATVAPAARRAVNGEKLQAYRRLHAHLVDEGFHCAHEVFRHLEDLIPARPALRDATSGFVGGTLFKGLTCSALTAGIMAAGLTLGEIENSRARVLRMIARMIVGGDAFDDELNEFSRSMNLGHRLSQWFSQRFGSTRCRAITGCDLSTTAGVDRFIEDRRVIRCRAAAHAVAAEVRGTIERASRTGGV